MNLMQTKHIALCILLLKRHWTIFLFGQCQESLFKDKPKMCLIFTAWLHSLHLKASNNNIQYSIAIWMNISPISLIIRQYIQCKLHSFTTIGNCL